MINNNQPKRNDMSDDGYWEDLSDQERQEITEVLALHNANEVAATILLDNISIIQEHQHDREKAAMAIDVASAVHELRQRIKTRGANEDVKH
jgi:ribonucleotide reductase beta subunit family protein with ferritin-like domain